MLGLLFQKWTISEQDLALDNGKMRRKKHHRCAAKRGGRYDHEV